MPWYYQLLTGTSVAGVVAVVCLVSAIGIGCGALRLRGVSLGIAGVLFSGIVFSHFFWSDALLLRLLGDSLPGNTLAVMPVLDHLKQSRREILEFLRELGLILFVYSIGMQVGPSFFGSLRAQGLRWNLLATGVLVLGFVCAALVHRIGHIDAAATVGILSGAVTNTPGLAAAQQALKDIPGLSAAQRGMSGVGYAVAYPFGVLGTIFSLIAIRLLFRVDASAEAERFREEARSKARPGNANLIVKNPGLVGKHVRDLADVLGAPVVVSRVMRKGDVILPQSDTVLEADDIMHAVGEPHDLERLQTLVGEATSMDIRTMSKKLGDGRLVVTRSAVIGKTLAQLNFRGAYGVNITRVRRAGIEFVPSSAYDLHYGDTLVAVGDADGLSAAERVVGNSTKSLESPQLVSLFVGIVCGVLVGSIPFTVSSLPAPVKLGLAGGPLVVALLFSWLGHVGRMSFYVPHTASLMLRELGIVLFLSCVGLMAGEQFVRTLREGDGFVWMAMGAIITVVPLTVIGIIGRVAFKVNYTALSGVLAGSMTDPPALAFANSLAGSEGAAVAYGTVYPVTMILRILTAQLFVILFASPGP
jgi:putative transport protein